MLSSERGLSVSPAPPAVFQDPYPKGVIPLAAIQMARPAKDNKFEVVTNQRIFVFRTENEGKRQNTENATKKVSVRWFQFCYDAVIPTHQTKHRPSDLLTL